MRIFRAIERPRGMPGKLCYSGLNEGILLYLKWEPGMDPLIWWHAYWARSGRFGRRNGAIPKELRKQFL